MPQEFTDSAYRLLAKYGLKTMRIRTSIRTVKSGVLTINLTTVEFTPGSPSEFLAMQGKSLGRADAKLASGSDIAALFNVDLRGSTGLESILGQGETQSDSEGDKLCAELLAKHNHEGIERAHAAFLSGIGIERDTPFNPLDYAKRHLTTSGR